MKWWIGWVLIMCVGCMPSAEVTPTAPIVALKQLATVEIPPTPDRAQLEATRRAQPQPPTAIPATATPTQTPYIGVFIGAAVNPNNAPFQDPGIVAAPTNDTSCAVPFDLAFGEGWRTNPSVARRVGCALQERFGFAASVQIFERGVMYRRNDTSEVWAITPGSISAGEYWYFTNTGLIPLPLDITPPEGLRVPVDTFALAWGNSEVNEALGFATTPEQVADLNVQRFEGGSLFLDVTVGQVFILFDNGDAFGPY